MARRWRRLVVLTVGVLLVPVGVGRIPAALACSCLPRDDAGDLAAADVVFEGVAIERIDPSPPSGALDDTVTWRFDVTSVVKGAATDPQDVLTARGGNLCGSTFGIGTAYRVFARREGSGLTTTICSGNRALTGYRMAAADGGVFAFGASTFHGSAGGLALNAPIVGIAATPSGRGYWLAAADGGVFAYGDAGFFGSAGGLRLNAPVVGITASPTGAGYWLAAADGGVFAYGDARYSGSAAGLPLQGPVVDIAATGSGGGYWLLGIDGGVFAFGAAGFFGSPSSDPSRRTGPATGITASHSGTGYWISDDSAVIGGYGDTTPVGPLWLIAFSDIVGVSRTSGSARLVIASSRGMAVVYDEIAPGDLTGQRLNAPIVAVSG